jgi:predicted RNA-binding Zn ribbon-like protein
LANKKVISDSRSAELLDLTQSDPSAAATLLRQADQLGQALRFAFTAMLEGAHVNPDGIDSINHILSITEGYDQLQWNGTGWKLGFHARHDRLEWLLAAIARSAAELLAEGPESGLRRCDNSNCRLMFYDDSRTHRRRWCSMSLCGNRSKVAAFARRQSGEKARAHHA